MEVHRQRCQKCNSLEMKNILTRENKLPTVVYLRCADCGELVARYELSDYYHHGKGIESFLRSRTVDMAESGRHLLELFEEAERRATEGYAEAVAELERQGKKI